MKFTTDSKRVRENIVHRNGDSIGFEHGMEFFFH